MDDLLKEAIADAKAVRETALENAKMALEEAFTPRLQSMLSKKIQTELEDEEDEYGDEEEMGEPEMDAEPEMDMGPEDEEPEEGMDMEGVIEINGIKYAPVIEQEDEEGEEEMEEGCLSVPEVFDVVKRAEKIRIRYLQIDGLVTELDADGLLAVCVQHEIDHLDGKLFIDYLSPLKRRRLVKKLDKQEKLQAKAL